MPKPTFFNLPASKREALIDRALREFAEHPFHRASLSRIVSRAGIAKGSLYQYFDDKFDLYRWLLTEEVPRRRMEASPLGAGDSPPADLGELLRALVRSGVRFLLDNPVLVGVANAVTQPTSDPQLQALYREVRDAGHARFVALLAGMRDAGQLRADLDLDLVGRVIGLVLGQGLPELLLGRAGVGLADLLQDPAVASHLEGEHVERVIDEAVRLLLEGLRPQ